MDLYRNVCKRDINEKENGICLNFEDHQQTQHDLGERQYIIPIRDLLQKAFSTTAGNNEAKCNAIDNVLEKIKQKMTRRKGLPKTDPNINFDLRGFHP